MVSHSGALGRIAKPPDVNAGWFRQSCTVTIPVDGNALRSPDVSAPSLPDISVGEMAEKYGGAKQFLEQVKVLMEDYGLTKDQALDELRYELKNEAFVRSRGGKNWLGETVTRKSIQDHNRHSFCNPERLGKTFK